jgi:hypothetical protein
LLRISVAVFCLGLVFVILTFVPFFAGLQDAPVFLATATMLAPLGFALALVALIRDTRRSQRAFVAELGGTAAELGLGGTAGELGGAAELGGDQAGTRPDLRVDRLGQE